MSDGQKLCRFCPEYIIKETEPQYTFDELKVFGTENFDVISDISPVAPAHTLIVSKEHVTAMSLLSDELRAEMKQIINVMRTYNRDIHGRITEGFEHGSGTCGIEGCVDHAHFHVLSPRTPGAIEIATSKLEFEKTDFENMNSSQLGSFGYLAFMDATGELMMHSADFPIPRQFGRQVYQEITKTPYNWRESIVSNPDNMIDVKVQDVKEHFKGLESYIAQMGIEINGLNFQQYDQERNWGEIYRNQVDGKPIENFVDKILYENDSFFIVTQENPIIACHTRIVSKRPMVNLSYCDEKEQKDLFEIINLSKTVYAEANTDKDYIHTAPIFFENASCTNSHATMYVLPIPKTVVDARGNRIPIDQPLDEDLDGFELQEVESFQQLFQNTDDEYNFIIDQNGQMAFATDAGSNLSIEEVLNSIANVPLTSFDKRGMRENTFEDQPIYQTFKKLQPLFRKHQSNKPLKYIYYARGIDNLNAQEVVDDYNEMEQILSHHGMTLANSVSKKDHTIVDTQTPLTDLQFKEKAWFIARENFQNLVMSDAIIADITIPNRQYHGCITELMWNKQQGGYNIVYLGENMEILQEMPHEFAYVQDITDGNATINRDQALKMLIQENERRKIGKLGEKLSEN